MAGRDDRLHELGVVLIGRNEAARLRLGLASIPKAVGGVVYVDSGSSDDSVEVARSRGVSVLPLDPATPFTAARARNEGFAQLLARDPSLEWVQFLDGDCSLADGWLEHAVGLLDADPSWLAVCGWRRERHPERTIYNRLCDLEWAQAPLGDVAEVGFGGDVMIRVEAFRRAGGYDASLIAGEDPELSARLRHSGGQVMRVDRAMTWHDADMQRLAQWWMRCVRSGHAYAEVFSRHRPLGTFRRQMRSMVLWGVAMPVALAASAALAPPAFAALAGVYAVQVARIARGLAPRRFPLWQRLAWGLSCVVSQVPNVQGMIRFARNRRGGRREGIIEYK